MQIRLDEGVVTLTITRPFTLRELTGPWSWIAIRYYWFAFDDLALNSYVELANKGLDPTELILLPALRNLAANVELVLEQTPLAFRIVDSDRGSVLLKIAGSLVALRKLVYWLPV